MAMPVTGRAGADETSNCGMETGTEVGQNVAEQVCGDDDVEAVRVHHQLHRAVVDDHFFLLDLGKFLGNFPRHFEEQTGG